MSTYTTDSSPQTRHEPTDQRRTELSELRQRLFQDYRYVRDKDPDLYREILEWLRKSTEVPDGNVGSAVKSSLRTLKRNNKMRDHRGVDDPADAFPDECEECPHYGIQCPMLKRYSVTKTLDRILRTAESDEEVVERVTDLAIDNDCHVVLDELEDYQGSHGEFLQTGYGLYSRVLDVFNDNGDDPESADMGVTTTFDGPPPDVQAEIEETVDAVMGDDEEDDAS